MNNPKRAIEDATRFDTTNHLLQARCQVDVMRPAGPPRQYRRQPNSSLSAVRAGD